MKILQHSKNLLKNKALLFSILFAFVGLLFLAASFAQESNKISISGFAYQDSNENGRKDEGEKPWAGHVIYLTKISDGSLVKGVSTSSDGFWNFENIPNDNYKVTYSQPSWATISDEWVPTTTGSEFPEIFIQDNTLSLIQKNFGWRQINTSSNIDEPITSTLSNDGIVIYSYNDAVSAEQVLKVLNKGSLRGDEADKTTIYFGLPQTDVSYASTGSGGVPGLYADYKASVFISYKSWLFGGKERSLFHEYGHAWADYHDRIIQQNGQLDSYINYRGLEGNEKLHSNHSWSPAEMIAEDYRQLFGSASAASFRQENSEITPANEVDGLKEWLTNQFMVNQDDSEEDPQTPSEDPDTEAPTAPSELVILSQSTNNATIGWKSSTDNQTVKEYWIFSNVTTGKGKNKTTQTEFLGSTFETTFQINDLSSNTTYNIFVVAVDEAGNESQPSETLIVELKNKPGNSRRNN